MGRTKAVDAVEPDVPDRPVEVLEGPVEVLVTETVILHASAPL
jgi:hypothetical protein